MALDRRPSVTTLALVALLALGILAVFWWRGQSDRRGQGARSTSDSVAPDQFATGPDTRRVTAEPSGIAGRDSLPFDKGQDAPGTEPLPATITVTGDVTNLESKKPAPQVDVIFAKGMAEWTATSNAEGHYSLVMAPGTYQVRAIGDRVMGIQLPALALGHESMTYDVGVVEHSVIRGHAHYEGGAAAAGAIVIPQSEDKALAMLSARGELGSAEVQDDGSFELFTMAGSFTLHASDKSASGEVVVLKLKSGEQREGIKVVLVPNGFVAGTVRDPEGLVIEDATVLISVQIPGTGEYDRVPVKSDRRGRFRYQLPRSTHTIVEARADGYAQSAPQNFKVKPSASRNDLELVLHRANYSLVGHVLDEEGEPLAYVQIAQGQEGSKARYKKALTNAEGRFEIENLGPGPHRLRARKRGYQQTRLRNIAAPADKLEIVMPADDGS